VGPRGRVGLRPPPPPPPELQAHCQAAGMPLAAVERFQLLSSFCDMLPGPVAAAHAEPIMSRQHMEVLPQKLLQQVSRAAGCHVCCPPAGGRHCCCLTARQATAGVASAMLPVRASVCQQRYTITRPPMLCRRWPKHGWSCRKSEPACWLPSLRSWWPAMWEIATAVLAVLVQRPPLASEPSLSTSWSQVGTAG